MEQTMYKFMKDKTELIMLDFTMYSLASMYFILKFQSFITALI